MDGDLDEHFHVYAAADLDVYPDWNIELHAFLNLHLESD